MSRISDVVSRFIQKFRGERALAYAGAVGFHYAENVLHHMRSDAGADAGTAGGRMGRGNERIGAIVAVQTWKPGRLQRVRSCLPSPGSARCSSYPLHRDGAFPHSPGNRPTWFHNQSLPCRRAFRQHILLGHIVFQLFCKGFLVHKVAHADADAVDLICIAGADAILGGADLAASFLASSASSRRIW